MIIRQYNKKLYVSYILHRFHQRKRGILDENCSIDHTYG